MRTEGQQIGSKGVAMGLTLHVERKGTYLYLTITGVYDLVSAKRITEQLFEACRSHGMPKGLVDIRSVEGEISTIERFEYAEFFVRCQRDYRTQEGKLIRLACFGTEPFVDPDRFGLTVALNRGAILLVTTDIDEALKWLDVIPAKNPDAGAPQ